MNVINKQINMESETLKLISANKIKPLWFIISIVWVMFGTYIHNELLTNRNILTKVLFLSITLVLTWQNKDVLKDFFRPPFKDVGKPNSISNVLWIYPFSVLMSSVIFVLTLHALGWTSSDPQNIEQISLTISEYISRLLTLPLVVFAEESVNVLVVVALSKLLSKRLKHGWLLAAVVISSFFFGAIHISAWGLEAAFERMFIHLSFIFSILYLRTAWVSMLAHTYQNALTYTSIIYAGFSELFVTYGGLAFIIILLYRSIRGNVKTKSVQDNKGR